MYIYFVLNMDRTSKVKRPNTTEKLIPEERRELWKQMSQLPTGFKEICKDTTAIKQKQMTRAANQTWQIKPHACLSALPAVPGKKWAQDIKRYELTMGKKKKKKQQQPKDVREETKFL